MKLRRLCLALCWLSTSVLADGAANTKVKIDQLIDGFHAAAAQSDAAGYLGRMTDEAVFMGTDEWERWPKHPDFTNYVQTRFKDGGWSYRSVERHIVLAPAGDSAWFDEVTFSETNGRFRGTGVVVKTTDGWKIAHYAMSFLILNENWEQVIKLTKSTKSEMAEQQPQ